jgi:hypothetical protein
VLAAPAPCRPCAHRACPTDHACATGTTAEDVLTSVDEVRELVHA